MPDVHFFDFNLEHIRRVPKCNTRWTLHYNDIGTFECHLSLSSDFMREAIERLRTGKYFVARQKNQTAIIIGYDTQKDFVLYGRTCNWILTKRITKKFEEITDTPPALAAKFVTEAFSDTPILTIGNIAECSESVSFIKDNHGVTFDFIKECLGLRKYGHSVSLDVDKKIWLFNVNYGVERNFLLSEANKQAYDCRLTYDVLDLANCGYYEKEIITIDDEGNESSETETTYIETDKTGLLRWEALLDGKSESEANSDLSKKKVKDSSNFSTRRLGYGIDYELGDILKIQIIKGAYRTTMSKRVTGIELDFDENGTTEKPILEDLEV